MMREWGAVGVVPGEKGWGLSQVITEEMEGGSGFQPRQDEEQWR